MFECLLTKKHLRIIIFFLLLIITLVLYISKQDPLYLYLGLFASILQIAEYLFQTFYTEKKSSQEQNKIILERKYREGPIEREKITYFGSEALSRYVNGMQYLLAEKMKPASDEILKSIIFLKEGNNEEAEINAREAIKLLENSSAKQSIIALSQAYMILGSLAFSKGIYKEAEKHYNLVQQLAESFHDNLLKISSLNGLLAAKGNQGDLQQALNLSKKVLEINPKFEIGLYNRGLVLGKLGRFEEALVSLNKAIELNSNLYQAWNVKGVI